MYSDSNTAGQMVSDNAINTHEQTSHAHPELHMDRYIDR